MFYDLIELGLQNYVHISRENRYIAYGVLWTHVVQVAGSISVKALSLNQLLWTGTTDELRSCHKDESEGGVELL